MELGIVLLVVRIGAGLLLVAFCAALFVLIWRDYRVISREVESRTLRRGRLVVVGSQESPDARYQPGTAFPLLPLTRIGRAPTNTIILEDTFASGEHALVTLRGGQWWLEDLGSSNGTNLNGYRIQEPVIVSTGDVIAVGQVALKLELE